ncbi:MAG: hypothetical protein L6R42_004864, partial [Xanthoria sp. 1 TBL-2021]
MRFYCGHIWQIRAKDSHSVEKPTQATESGKKDTTAGSYDNNCPVQDAATEDTPGDCVPPSDTMLHDLTRKSDTLEQFAETLNSTIQRLEACEHANESLVRENAAMQDRQALLEAEIRDLKSQRPPAVSRCVALVNDRDSESHASNQKASSYNAAAGYRADKEDGNGEELGAGKGDDKEVENTAENSNGEDKGVGTEKEDRKKAEDPRGQLSDKEEEVRATKESGKEAEDISGELL